MNVDDWFQPASQLEPDFDVFRKKYLEPAVDGLIEKVRNGDTLTDFERIVVRNTVAIYPDASWLMELIK